MYAYDEQCAREIDVCLLDPFNFVDAFFLVAPPSSRPIKGL